jgi:flagellin-like protein
MNLDSFLRDDSAVSPVIGVVLMVGITVVVMGLVGAFVLGATPSESAPNAEFVITQIDGTEVDIRYAGGEPAFRENIRVQVDGNIALKKGTSDPAFDGTGVLEKGDSVVIEEYQDGGGETPIGTGDIVTVVWESDNGGSSARLETHEML